jgi:hypothetical protein
VIENSTTPYIMSGAMDHISPFPLEGILADVSSDLEEMRWRRKGDGGEETVAEERGGAGGGTCPSVQDRVSVWSLRRIRCR